MRFATISTEFFNLKLLLSKSKNMFRNWQIAVVICCKLDENWPNLVVNLLFANGYAIVSPIQFQNTDSINAAIIC